MKRPVGLLMLIVTFLAGMVVGYGLGFGAWGVRPSQIAQIQGELRRVTRDVFHLKTEIRGATSKPAETGASSVGASALLSNR